MANKFLCQVRNLFASFKHPCYLKQNTAPHIKWDFFYKKKYFFNFNIFNRHKIPFDSNLPETVRKIFVWETNPNRSDQRLKLLFSSSFKIAMRAFWGEIE